MGLGFTFALLLLGGFREIIEGKHDEIPESYFLFAGSIDEVVEKYKKGREGK